MKQLVERKEEKSQNLRRKLKESLEISGGLEKVMILRRS